LIPDTDNSESLFTQLLRFTKAGQLTSRPIYVQNDHHNGLDAWHAKTSHA
jgi:hypothetical protein